jgi:hypothetical protein
MAISKRGRKRKPSRGKKTLDAYRAVRKPVAPPGRVERDRRRDIEQRRTREEIAEGLARRRRRT